MRSPLRGFTLVELLIVLAVLGLLAMAVMPMAEISVQRDRERELRRNLWEIRDAIDAYKRAVDSGTVELSSGASGGSVAIRKLEVVHTLPVAFQPSSNATGSASLSSKILNATEPAHVRLGTVPCRNPFHWAVNAVLRGTGTTQD